MNESFSQLNLEKSLPLERQEVVSLHNEILKENENSLEQEKIKNFSDFVQNGRKIFDVFIDFEKDIKNIQ